MATHTPEELAHEERRYLQIFLALGILTVLEIGVIYMPLPRFAIATGLVVFAATKAALVALYFMHLADEHRTLTWIALTPAIICIWLLLMLTPDLGSIARILTRSAPPAPTAH